MLGGRREGGGLGQALQDPDDGSGAAGTENRFFGIKTCQTCFSFLPVPTAFVKPLIPERIGFSEFGAEAFLGTW